MNEKENMMTTAMDKAPIAKPSNIKKEERAMAENAPLVGIKPENVITRPVLSRVFFTFLQREFITRVWLGMDLLALQKALPEQNQHLFTLTTLNI